jgi:hypothetical protein
MSKKTAKAILTDGVRYYPANSLEIIFWDDMVRVEVDLVNYSPGHGITVAVSQAIPNDPGYREGYGIEFDLDAKGARALAQRLRRVADEFDAQEREEKARRK